MAKINQASTRTTLSRDKVMLIARALSDQRRFTIFEQIASAEPFIGCSDLLKISEITPATMSHHLKELESAGLITVARTGKFMQMRVRRDTWKAYLAHLRNI